MASASVLSPYRVNVISQNTLKVESTAISGNILKQDLAQDPDFKGIKFLVDQGMETVPEKYCITYEPGKGDAILPIVDFNDPQAVFNAAKDTGIFYLINHNVDTISILESSFDFFNLPNNEKMKYWTEDIFVPIRYCSSMTPSLETKLEWHDHLQLWGHDTQKMIWPNNFENVGTEYVSNIFEVGKQILGYFSEGLQLNKEALQNALGSKPWIMFRSNFFPQCIRPESALGQDEHTDSGCMTILLQDQVGGLQIMQEGKWVNVKPIPGTLIINMGDQMEKFTNGNLKSILHRVVVQPDRHRQSVVCFMTPDPDTEVEALEDLKTIKTYTKMTYRNYIKTIYTTHFNGKNVLSIA